MISFLFTEMRRHTYPFCGVPCTAFPTVLLLVSVAQVVAHFTSAQRALRLHAKRDFDLGAMLGALFAHVNAAHLANNLTTGLAIGVWVEALHGHARFTLLYFATGLGGTLSYRAAWCADGALRPVAYVGASPAIYGLMGASAAHLFLNWSEVHFRTLWFAIALTVLASDVFLYVHSPRANVAYASHLGGAAWGLLLGPLVLRNAVVRAHERVVASLAAVGLVFLLLASLLPCD